MSYKYWSVFLMSFLTVNICAIDNLRQQLTHTYKKKQALKNDRSQ